MAQATPTTEPARLIAGDTARWLIAGADYPATDGWSLAYSLVNAATRISFSSTADGVDHLINVPAATTASWAPGAYEWRAQAVHATLGTFTIRSGSTTVQPAFGAAVDARSHAAKALAAIESYLETGSNLAAGYEIAGRRLNRYPLPDLLALRDRYRAEVARDQAAADAARGLPSRARVFVRFGP